MIPINPPITNYITATTTTVITEKEAETQTYKEQHGVVGLNHATCSIITKLSFTECDVSHGKPRN